jgi:hypothetical protein
MYLFCNSRIHVITLYSGHVCVYYKSMLRCWHLVWILVRTDHPCLGVGCHTAEGTESAQLSDVGSHSGVGGDVDEGSHTRSYLFEPSTVTVSRIRGMINNGYFVEGRARELGEETVLEHNPDEAMVF